MRFIIQFISILFISSAIFGQNLNDTLSKLRIKTNNDSFKIKIIVQDVPQGEHIYYLDGKQIDTKKYFITPDNIKNTYSFKSDSSNKIDHDPICNKCIYINSKPELKLLTLIEILKLHKLDYYELDQMEIRINDNQILDTTILIDSLAQVIPIYKKEAGKSKENFKNKIVGCDIYTNKKGKQKKE